MPEMVEYALESGGSILVAVEGTSGPVTRGWSDDRARRVTEQTSETFEATVAKVRPAADAMLASLSGLSSTPHEITVEFAVQLTAGAGVCIATLGSTANFKIALTWKPS
jgi:Trypsin-co-occurring domain 1